MSALTIDNHTANIGNAQEFDDEDDILANAIFSFASQDISEVIDLTDVSVGVFTQAIENIATLRADNGGFDVQTQACCGRCGLAEDQYDRGQWTDQGCGYRHGEYKSGEVPGTGTGVRSDACPGQHQHRCRPHATEIRAD